MASDIAERMEAGSLGTRWPRIKARRHVMPEGEHPGMHIALMPGYRRCSFNDVALAGCHLYLDVMRHFAELFRDAAISPLTDARITKINGPVGMMRRDLRT